MPTFITPFQGQAELTASNGLSIIEQNAWRFSQSGYNDGATFGASLTGPARGDPGAPASVPSPGLLSLQARNWPIAVIGNQLTDYVGEDSQLYPASRCRILIVGQWIVTRRPNSNSFNSQGVIYQGRTETDAGSRDMQPFLLNLISTPLATYVIQGADVEGGAKDTFSQHLFYCHITESATTENSNHEFQSNSIARPIWSYTYSKSWQLD